MMSVRSNPILILSIIIGGMIANVEKLSRSFFPKAPSHGHAQSCISSHEAMNRISLGVGRLV